MYTIELNWFPAVGLYSVYIVHCTVCTLYKLTGLLAWLKLRHQIDGLDSLERANETIGNKLKNQYPRNCDSCKKYLRNSLDFRKHVVACVMARK